MRRSRIQVANASTSYVFSNEEHIISIPDEPPPYGHFPTSSIPLQLTPIFSQMSTATGSSYPTPNNHHLIQTILAFTLSALVALLSSLDDQTLTTQYRIKTFICYMTVAFCSSLASIYSKHRHNKTPAVLDSIAVLSTALGFASIASMFVPPWCRLAAYGFCLVVPLCAFVQPKCECIPHTLDQSI